MSEFVTEQLNQRRLGPTQRRLLTRFFEAEAQGVTRLSTVELAGEGTDDDMPRERRLRRVTCRRVCRLLIKRGLLRDAGTVTSVTGQAEGDLIQWAGRRVPKGYERQALCFELTEKGRRELIERRVD